ncbi:metallophosphoesterase 1 isoform X2 [Teleopsis dalmanni]|uniref:metallophosphoesterase 1 isoform X2 n=1 Tax=Teleopsis dalmanni TaxID=139649 RepID=UPI0018CD6009|nr:metallophosphoesterase 1 isoform X2 [Teleopsis dalmanni]
MATVRIFNRLVLRGLFLSTILLIFFNEVLIYYIYQRSWQYIDCKYDNCTRILFIADSQLLGKTFDTSFYSPLARYDSDRYLQKTFERSFAYARPHIVCFLGDLLDEGNIASPQEFDSYVHRFHKIYSAVKNVQSIHIPGDNDIGGENGEYISNSNIRRFEQYFTDGDLFDYNNSIRFFKINRMMLDYKNPDRENNANRLRIGLSHAPILIGGGPLLRAILVDLDPHVIFSAHWHESRIFIHPSTKVINFYKSSTKHFNLKTLKEDHTYIEIMVPTASYRMGKTKIGIGYGVLDYNLTYTVLWSPNRFVFLLLYVFWLIIALSGVIVFRMMTRCPFRVSQRHYSRTHAIPQF